MRRAGAPASVSIVKARDSASTWSSLRPNGKSRSSSRKAWFQPARTMAKLRASTCDATGAARVVLAPVSRRGRYAIAGKATGEVGGLVLAGLSRVFRQADADGSAIDACGFRNGSFDFMWRAAHVHHIQHNETTGCVTRHLHTDGPVRIVAAGCRGRGKIPGTHDHAIGARRRTHRGHRCNQS